MHSEKDGENERSCENECRVRVQVHTDDLWVCMSVARMTVRERDKETLRADSFCLSACVCVYANAHVHTSNDNKHDICTDTCSHTRTHDSECTQSLTSEK